MPYDVSLELVRKRWAWSHERHFPPQYVKELRKFIQARAAQELANGGDPRIVRHFVHRLAAVLFLNGQGSGDEIVHILFVDCVIGLEVHRPKLEEGKLLAILPQPR